MKFPNIFGGTGAKSGNDETNSNPNKFAHVKNQFVAVFFVNLMTISHGMLLGWLSPASIVLSGDDSPMVGGPVDIGLIAWIGAISNAGSLIGNFAYTWLTNRFGRRVTFFVLALPNIVFWIGVIFIRVPEYLLLIRLIGGLSGGGVLICIPLYVAEIASDHVRGALGSILVLSLNFGFFISYVTGAFLPYNIAPCVHIVFPLLFLLGSFFLPESPQFLIEHGKLTEAEQSLRFYKGCISKKGASQRRFEDEFTKLNHYANKEAIDELKYTLKDFTNAEAVRGFVIGFSMMAINIFSGGLLMLNYASTIFKDSGSDLDSNVSSIILISVQIIGTFLASLLVDKLGRRKLMFASTFGTAIASAIMGTFNFMSESGYELQAFNWVPVASLSLSLFSASFGIFPLAFVVLAEVLPAKIRSVGSSICTSLISIFLFLVVRLFPLVVELIGLYGVFWFFACVCALGMLFTIFVLPETTGKDINAN